MWSNEGYCRTLCGTLHFTSRDGGSDCDGKSVIFAGYGTHWGRIPAIY